MNSGAALQRFAVGFSGGSGIAYGLRLVEVLLRSGHEVHLCATGAALRVMVHEAGLAVDLQAPDLAGLFAAELRPRLKVHPLDAVEAAPASGSAGIRATILCPCSMGTLARVAHGFSSNLVERSADVALKEGRPLLVVPRETPLSELHLENMLRLARLGAIVLPAMPGFYHRPQTVQELVDFVVGKILDRLQVPHALTRRWDTPAPKPTSPWDEGEVG
ncbi:MAG: UbiX family flavin prenyltransferase [Planctomycetes bacterium]|jgi:4-hydroxy-3-polyprenylbenzoate decarboxylase|nr:UbiX family flavin prenyltransferase [Planctomycetota bacterium]